MRVSGAPLPDAVARLAFAPDGQEIFAVVGLDVEVRMYDVSEGGGRVATSWVASLAHDAHVTAIAAAPGRLFTGTYQVRPVAPQPHRRSTAHPFQGHIFCWNTSQDEVYMDWLIAADTEPIVAVVPAGERLFTDASRDAAAVWQAAGQPGPWELSGRFESRAGCPGHNEGVTAVLYQGESLFTASHDCTIKVWNIETRSAIDTITSLDATAHVLAWEPGRRWLYAGCEDGTVRVFDAGSTTGHRQVARLEGHKGAVTALAVAAAHVYSGGEDGRLHAWRIGPGGFEFVAQLLPGSPHKVLCAAHCPVTRRLAVGRGNDLLIMDLL